MPNTASVLHLAEIAPRWLAVSTPRAIPLMITNPCAARSHPRRSTIRFHKKSGDVFRPSQFPSWSALQRCPEHIAPVADHRFLSAAADKMGLPSSERHAQFGCAPVPPAPIPQIYPWPAIAPKRPEFLQFGQDARKTPSEPPKCSASFRDFVGPSPGVSARPSHSRQCTPVVVMTAFDKGSSRAGLRLFFAQDRLFTSRVTKDLNWRTVLRRELACQGHPSQCFAYI